MGFCAKDALVLWLRPSFQKALSYLMSPPSAAHITVILHRCFCNFQTVCTSLDSFSWPLQLKPRNGNARAWEGAPPGRGGRVQSAMEAFCTAWIMELLCLGTFVRFSEGLPKGFPSAPKAFCHISPLGQSGLPANVLVVSDPGSSWRLSH